MDLLEYGLPTLCFYITAHRALQPYTLNPLRLIPHPVRTAHDRYRSILIPQHRANLRGHTTKEILIIFGFV